MLILSHVLPFYQLIISHVVPPYQLILNHVLLRTMAFLTTRSALTKQCPAIPTKKTQKHLTFLRQMNFQNKLIINIIIASIRFIFPGNRQTDAGYYS